MGSGSDFDRDPSSVAAASQVTDTTIPKVDASRTVQQQAGNLAMQHRRTQGAGRTTVTVPTNGLLSPLDQGLSDGKTASDLLELIESTLFPAYRNSVDAIDPVAALELARHVVGSMKLVEHARDNIIRILTGDDYHRFLVSDTQYPDESEPAISAKFAALEGYKLHLTLKIPLLQLKLAEQIGPQMFRGKPVLGDFVIPQLGLDPDSYLANEAGTAVELLSVVKNVLNLAGAEPGTSPMLTAAQADEIVGILEPWKSRPVNFAFLVNVLTQEGIWPSIAEVKGKSGKTLTETNAAVLDQVKQTGALADVGELGTQELYAWFGIKPNDILNQEIGIPAIDDETAMKIFEKLRDVGPEARGPLIRQIQGMGELDNLCDHLPWKYVQAMYESILPLDAQAAAMLVPFFSGKGGGESIHQIYMDKVDERIKEDHPIRAYGWFLLDSLHNAFTGGFEHEYSEAYDAREQGWITDDQFHSAAAKALGKAAVITVASALTGGAAGEFGEGLAAGLGASKSAAQIIGGAAGGVAGGVGGHFAGDVYDQMLSGKKGFDSFGEYMKSGALGGVIGTVTAGISVGAGKYLPSRFARPVDTFAESYPRMGKVLENIRSSGFRTGSTVRMKVSDLLDLMGSGFGGPGAPGAFAYAGAFSDVRGLPLDTEVSVRMRPIRPLTDQAQMSSLGSKAAAGETGSLAGASHGDPGGPFVEFEKVEVVSPDPATQVSKEQSVVEDESVQASVVEPETGVPEAKANVTQQPDSPAPAAADVKAEQIQRLEAENKRLSDQAKADEATVKAAKKKLDAAQQKVDKIKNEIIGRKKYAPETFARNPHLKQELDAARTRLSEAETERAQAEADYVGVKSPQDLRYHQIRENRAEVQRLSKPEQELSATERGRVNELRVLKEEGLVSTKRAFTVRDPKTLEFETTIPDGVRDNGRTVDVKDVAVLSETLQLRLQRVVSKMHGQKAEIITGQHTRVPAEMEINYLIRRRPDLGPQK